MHLNRILVRFCATHRSSAANESAAAAGSFRPGHGSVHAGDVRTHRRSCRPRACPETEFANPILLSPFRIGGARIVGRRVGSSGYARVHLPSRSRWSLTTSTANNSRGRACPRAPTQCSAWPRWRPTQRATRATSWQTAGVWRVARSSRTRVRGCAIDHASARSGGRSSRHALSSCATRAANGTALMTSWKTFCFARPLSAP